VNTINFKIETEGKLIARVLTYKGKNSMWREIRKYNGKKYIRTNYLDGYTYLECKIENNKIWVEEFENWDEPTEPNDFFKPYKMELI
jgi:hypothetical protein